MGGLQHLSLLLTPAFRVCNPNRGHQGISSSCRMSSHRTLGVHPAVTQLASALTNLGLRPDFPWWGKPQKKSIASAGAFFTICSWLILRSQRAHLPLPHFLRPFVPMGKAQSLALSHQPVLSWMPAHLLPRGWRCKACLYTSPYPEPWATGDRPGNQQF